MVESNRCAEMRMARWAASGEPCRGGAWMEPVEVASVSPGRMFGAGAIHLLIGLTWSLGPILGFMEYRAGGMGDLRPEVVAIVVILWPLGIPILLRGVALLQQS